MDAAPAFSSGPDALAQICADTLVEVSKRQNTLTIPAMKAKINARRDVPRSFGRALRHAAGQGRFGLIAEIKQASPSAGLIRPVFDPVTLAHDYADAGATCLSVLTEEHYFQGCPDHFMAARAAVALPMLRKDFILDPWQVYESRMMGADCILLIMAALTDNQARTLEELARALDMDVLVEVHDRAELDRALGLETSLIGINNRNLKTLRTDLATTAELAPHVPSDRFLIAESGIRTHADVMQLAACGAQCFLVGESLLRHEDVGAATRALLGTA